MEGLLERIQENRLDALYLFINESLRDRTTYDRFVRDLLHVLPSNWSIQRVEVGHEFLSMMAVPSLTDGTGQGNGNGRNGAGQQANNGQQQQQQPVIVVTEELIRRRRQQQYDLFEMICSLESLKTLIISDGYVPRKDNGSIPTSALLRALPLARNLNNLDLQRLGLRIGNKSTSRTCNRRRRQRRSQPSGHDDDEISDDDAEEEKEEDDTLINRHGGNNNETNQNNSNDHGDDTIQDSMELLDKDDKDDDQVQQLAGVFEKLHESLEDVRLTGLFLIQSEIDDANDHDEGGDNKGDNGTGSEQYLERNEGLLDPVIQACVDMTNLKSLAISLKYHSDMISELGEQQAIVVEEQRQPVGRRNRSRSVDHQRRSLQQLQSQEHLFLSKTCLQDLCQTSTTLQDLSLRAMQLTNDTCLTISKALTANSCFLTSLDIRQNPNITDAGYSVILQALERNYDLWCTVMVDNEQFQGKFNSLIELNQAGRGNLVHHPSGAKLQDFLMKLQDDPTAVWYFLTIHDSILYPLIRFLQWKEQKRKEPRQQREDNRNNPPRRNQEVSLPQPQQQQPTQPLQQVMMMMPTTMTVPMASSLRPLVPLAIPKVQNHQQQLSPRQDNVNNEELEYTEEELRNAIATATATTLMPQSSSQGSSPRFMDDSYTEEELQNAIATAAAMSGNQKKKRKRP